MKCLIMSRVVAPLTFMLIMIFIPSMLAHGADYKFRNITYDQGMHSSEVYKAVQDKDGMMWFALHDGLDKFNGYDFKHYELISPDHPGATHIPQVRSLILDEDQQIWTFSDNGLFRYDYLRDEFKLVITGLTERFDFDQIMVIHEDNTRKIWMGTNNGVVIYDEQNDSIFKIPDFVTNILSFYSETDSKLWIGTGEGLYLYDQEAGHFIDQTTRANVNARLLKMAVFSYMPFNDHQLLLGSRRNGLRLLDLRSGKMKKVNIPELSSLSYSIRDITYYDDKILLGTDGAGLVVLNSSLEFIRRYALNEDIPNSLSHNGIYDLFIDRENRLWISTYGGGVNLFDPNEKAFSVIQHQANNPNSLKANMGRAILEDGKKNLWFGTESGISILNRKTNTFRHIGFETGFENDLSAKTVLSMMRDREDHIWVGTFSGGIDIYNESAVKLNTLKFDSLNPSSLSTDYIYALYLDHEGDIWSGGIRGGVTRYNPSSGQFTRHDEVISVKCIIGDSGGRILVGTLNGLYYSDKNKNTFYLFHGMKDDSIEFVNRIFSIHEDKKGGVWIGSEGEGLSYIEIEKGLQKNYSVRDGLPSNIVYGILEDSMGNLWLSTTNGLSRFNTEEEEFTNFTVADKLSGKEFSRGAYCKTSDETFIFGGNRGFTLFRPNEIKLNERIPEIIFTNFYIFHKANKEAGIEEQKLNVNETEKIVLNHNQNSFSIEFSAINYTSTDKNLYRWKLDGLDQFENIWTGNSSERRAYFTGLPPGNYQFTVQASNNDGFWNTDGRTLQIVIQPSIWRSTLARIIYLFLTVVILFFIQRYIYLSIKERNAFEKIKFFINIAHDIRTPLTLIKAPVQDLIKHSEMSTEVTKNLELISNNTDKLNNLINQLLDFQKADMAKFKLKVAEESIPVLLKIVISNFESLAHKNNKTLLFKCENSELNGWIDKFILERIMYNLISNAIKYSHPGGKINIILEQNGDHMKISVSDQGIGISKDQQKHIFKRYYRSENIINSKTTGSGVGLMLTKRLAVLHKGDISFSSVENAGTTFYLSIPIKLNHYNADELCAPFEEPEKEKEETPSSVSYEGKRLPIVLIIEDSDELRDFLSDNLSKYYNTVTATNGREGLEVIKKNYPDLIISDIMMPEMDGIEFCISIRKSINTSHIPLILLTAMNSMQDKIRGLEYGADDYIEKPFDLDYLKARIDNLLYSRETLARKYMNKPDETTLAEIRSQPDRDLMNKAYEVVLEQYHDSEFSVEHFCRMMCVSRAVLYRKLKAYTDLSPQDFIKVIRLKKAEELLLTSVKSVKEIAYEVGFSDPRYFSVSFKKYFGKSPKEFTQI